QIAANLAAELFPGYLFETPIFPPENRGICHNVHYANTLNAVQGEGGAPWKPSRARACRAVVGFGPELVGAPLGPFPQKKTRPAKEGALPARRRAIVRTRLGSETASAGASIVTGAVRVVRGNSPDRSVGVIVAYLLPPVWYSHMV